jgi:quinol monooxygenase YgiN
VLWTTGVIIETLRILPSPSRRADVLEILRSIQGPALAQPGCAGFTLYEELVPERVIVLIGSWESMAALEAHIRSDAWRRILGAMELSDGRPELWFHEVVAREGMELVERFRTGESHSDRKVEARVAGSTCHHCADHRTTHRVRSRKEVRQADPAEPGGIE